MAGTGNVEPMQLAYRANYSTVMALLHVKTDLLDAIDKKEVTCLVLLDLSAAFDMVNHSILLQCLKYRFGIQGRVLDWITSYLTNRTQRVMIDDLESDPVELSRGVPQGSVLGPVLFNLYTSPLGDICKSHGIKYHQYANDTQNYFSFKPAIPGDDMHCIRTLQNCIKDIRIWMCTNMLKLNNDKTEFLVIGTKQQLSKVGDLSIQIGQDNINSIACMRNLGFYFDQNIKNTAHVNQLSSILYVITKKHPQDLLCRFLILF